MPLHAIAHARFRLAAIAFLVLMLGLGSGLAALAQNLPDDALADRKAEENQQQAKQRSEAMEALSGLDKLIAAEAEQAAIVKDLKQKLSEAKEDASKKELTKEVEAASAKLDQIEAQISDLSTGVTEAEFDSDTQKKFNLQEELESLAEPFVNMVKEATEVARRIDSLKGVIAQAERRQEVADRALERLKALQTTAQNVDTNDFEAAQALIARMLMVWDKRAKEASNLAQTSKQQLALRLKEQSGSNSRLGTATARFIRDRGTNLLLALAAFAGVFIIMRLLARLLEAIRRRQGIDRSFVTRLVSLIYHLATIIVAVLAMLVVLNMRNDWLLLAVVAVFSVALAWIGLKMIPTLVEQTTLLLNLGAVQEGERVKLNGVPWRVANLGYYTDLINPDLEGGSFTIPVRELAGLHSRPAGVEEAWFPTRKGDWVQLSDGKLGRVAVQTPELVQIIELGGAWVTYPTSDFLEQAPRNLSNGFRVEIVFGVDYRHQAIATEQLPQRLRAYVQAGLARFVPAEAIVKVQVELLRAGTSSIDYEVEADLVGEVAHLYEEVEREIARLTVEACNVNGWTIPFPQLVLHQG